MMLYANLINKFAVIIDFPKNNITTFKLAEPRTDLNFKE